MNSLSLLFVLIGVLILVLVLSILLEKRSAVRSHLPRKVLHIGAISICAVALLLPIPTEHIFLAAIIALPLVSLAVYFGFLRDPLSKRRSWGMPYFILSYCALLLAIDEREIVFYAMAILAISDGLATAIGAPFGKISYTLGGDTRSYLGSAVFFISTLGIFALGSFWPILPEPLALQPWHVLLFLSLYLTLCEAISAAGRDNLWLPLMAAYWLLLPREFFPDAGLTFAWVAALTGGGFLALRSGALDAGGAASAVLMGLVLLLGAEPLHVLLPGLFFLLGSVLSRLPQKMGKRSDSGGRSKAQVLANGGIPVLALMLYNLSGEQAFFFAFAVGFAAALSDTSSSELGTRLSSKSFALLGGRVLRAGSSGGVSLPGTIIGLFAAGLIPLLAYLLGWLSVVETSFAATIAFAANLFDSLLGQLFQQKYVDDSGAWTDQMHGAKQGNKRRGLRWMTNDMVNAISIAFACLSALILHLCCIGFKHL